MLSRVANSIYWMFRYIERAENVARFISVNTNLLLDMPIEGGNQWKPLIFITGDQDEYEKKYDDYKGESVVRFLTFDREYSNSIISCLAEARENGRSIREIISTEMWEHLNNFYLELTEPQSVPFALNEPDRFFKVIKMRSHLFSGLMDSTMSHGEAYNFAKIGSMLERADKTSRILDVKYFMLLPDINMVNSSVDIIQWIALLKSASALEMFRKKHHLMTPKQVANFLIFDNEFPRSIRHCISDADLCLHRITGTAMGSAGNTSEKLFGRLKADLEYFDIDEVVAYGMHEYLDELQIKLNKINMTIAEEFFNITPPEQSDSQQQ